MAESKVIKVAEQSSERLALMLNQSYTRIMESQQNIENINAELQRREQANIAKDEQANNTEDEQGD